MGRGRPPTPSDEQAVMLRLERRHVAILDELVRKRARAEFSIGQRLVEQRGAADGEAYTLERRVNLTAERRQLFGEIVEWYQRLHAAPTVKVVAPCESDPESRREAAAWVEAVEARLTDEAPVGIQVALARRALGRLDREDSETLVRVLRAARARRGKPGADDDDTA